MKAVVVYESMYGNTHHVASAIADGLEPEYEVTVVPVERAERRPARSRRPGGRRRPDPRSRHESGLDTRKAAVEAAEEAVERSHARTRRGGTRAARVVRRTSDGSKRAAAAFDTRVDMPPVLTGRASKGIAKKLRHAGATLVAEPESFLVTKDNHLEPGETGRARGGEPGWRAESSPTVDVEHHTE